VLTMIRAYPGVSNADLARLAMQTPQTVSVIVANLERSGAITRRPHAVHGRIQHIEVTPEGAALLAACRKRSGGIEQELL
ncbi:MarR family transcriptional regulator, partial [Acinetobacter baumannii]